MLPVGTESLITGSFPADCSVGSLIGEKENPGGVPGLRVIIRCKSSELYRDFHFMTFAPNGQNNFISVVHV